jgi:hypothetical protein
VVDLPLSAKGLLVAEDADGGVVLANRAGEVVVAATPQARVWDASSDRRSGLPVHEVAVDAELANLGNS